jgi:hypothetical protein
MKEILFITQNINKIQNNSQNIKDLQHYSALYSSLQVF